MLSFPLAEGVQHLLQNTLASVGDGPRQGWLGGEGCASGR